MPEGGLLAELGVRDLVAVDVEVGVVAVPGGGDVGPLAGRHLGSGAGGVDRVLGLAEGEVAAADEQLPAAAVAEDHHVGAVTGLDPGLHRVGVGRGGDPVDVAVAVAGGEVGGLVLGRVGELADPRRMRAALAVGGAVALQRDPVLVDAVVAVAGGVLHLRGAERLVEAVVGERVVCFDELAVVGRVDRVGDGLGRGVAGVVGGGDGELVGAEVLVVGRRGFAGLDSRSAGGWCAAERIAAREVRRDVVVEQVALLRGRTVDCDVGRRLVDEEGGLRRGRVGEVAPVDRPRLERVLALGYRVAGAEGEERVARVVELIVEVAPRATVPEVVGAWGEAVVEGRAVEPAIDIIDPGSLVVRAWVVPRRDRVGAGDVEGPVGGVAR